MKTMKTVRKGFGYDRCDDFAAYLSKMAAQGWHFREWSTGLKFQRGEPAQVTYAVEVFIHGSDYDTRPEPKTREFAEYCLEAGWELVDAKQKYCIFRKIREDAEPILTDPERLENTAKVLRGNLWQLMVMSAVFAAMQWTDVLGLFFIQVVFSQLRLTSLLIWSVLLPVSIIRIIQFYLWQAKCRRRIDRGEALHFSRGKDSFASGWHTLALGVVVIVMLLGYASAGEYWQILWFFVLLAVLLGLGLVIAKVRPSALNNQIIQILVVVGVFLCGMFLVMWVTVDTNNGRNTDTPPPLVYEDLGVEAGELVSASVYPNKSMLGTSLRAVLRYEKEFLFYDVYRTPHQWILDRVWEEELSAKYNANLTDCTDLWEADVAYRNALGEYRVRYEDAIVFFNGVDDLPLSREQVDTIRSVLLQGR